ncbi:MAG: tRNA threonylcarbamoyladenosine dehydratase [Verrucomicrobia bacterium]|nr:tRNA threonylcarbamoyladenosine dehydratase [Verrucomicrobiota bacterium]
MNAETWKDPQRTANPALVEPLCISGVTSGRRRVHVAGVSGASSLQHRFGGIARLYGQAALARFLRARVAVIGIGGVGSWAVEALARSGIGHLTLVDLDEICVTNVNRQLHAMDGQIGRQKTAAMAERVRAIHPGCEVEVIPAFFNEKTAAVILDAGFEVLLDAIDSSRHKALLLAECRRRGIYSVTCGGAGGRRDPTRIRVTDLAFSGKDPLLLQLRRSLRHDHGFPKVARHQDPAPLGIDAVFSDEAPVYAQCDGSVSEERPDGADLRLNCASGFGSATHVTACFGLIAAGRVLERLAR